MLSLEWLLILHLFVTSSSSGSQYYSHYYNLWRHLESQPFSSQIIVKERQDWFATGNFEITIMPAGGGKRTKRQPIHSKRTMGDGVDKSPEERQAIYNAIEQALKELNV